jgi:hypothetical protein
LTAAAENEPPQSSQALSEDTQPIDVSRNRADFKGIRAGQHFGEGPEYLGCFDKTVLVFGERVRND